MSGEIVADIEVQYSNLNGCELDSEIAKLMREHNDANILVLPGRFMDIHEAIKCVENFLNTDFESGRHKKRIDKI